ncbi:MULTISPECIES: hypothetical protein [Rhodococcus]|nr:MULTISPECIES: hypothetical protein [Rhodococcus]
MSALVQLVEHSTWTPTCGQPPALINDILARGVRQLLGLAS